MGAGLRLKGKLVVLGPVLRPPCCATSSSRDPVTLSSVMVRLAGDGAMFKIARFLTLFRYASERQERVADSSVRFATPFTIPQARDAVPIARGETGARYYPNDKHTPPAREFKLDFFRTAHPVERRAQDWRCRTSLPAAKGRIAAWNDQPCATGPEGQSWPNELTCFPLSEKHFGCAVKVVRIFAEEKAQRATAGRGTRTSAATCRGRSRHQSVFD